VAIIGSGVSGLVSAHLLYRHHEITLYEADIRVGGHVNTINVARDDGVYAIDTGFIVYNERNYPGFTRLLDQLGVPTQASDMSFSVSCAQTGLEYRTTSANTLFAQRRNLARPSFIRLLADIPRFNRAARRLLGSDDLSVTLAEFLDAGGYSRSFIDHYIVPLGASIWSADPARFTRFPAAALARFLDRHGLASLGDRPRWRTVTGGATRYVERLILPFRSRIRLGSPVRRVEREDGGVTVFTDDNGGERFDSVVLATHANQSLAMLARPTPLEARVLSAIQYRPNRATLHTDERALPRSRRAWASWNYQHLADHDREEQREAALTYHANQLQSIASADTFCTTLNSEDRIDPETIIASFDYEHPVFDGPAMRMQRRHNDLNGTLNTYYCGAYWGWGFHEDGVQSALVAMRHFGETL
jgi:uncharacterized protein